MQVRWYPLLLPTVNKEYEYAFSYIPSYSTYSKSNKCLSAVANQVVRLVGRCQERRTECSENGKGT